MTNFSCAIMKYMCAIMAFGFLVTALLPSSLLMDRHEIINPVVPQWALRMIYAANFLFLGSISYGLQTRKPIYWRLIPFLLTGFFLSLAVGIVWSSVRHPQPVLPFVFMLGFFLIGMLFFILWWQKQKDYFVDPTRSKAVGTINHMKVLRSSRPIPLELPMLKGFMYLCALAALGDLATALIPMSFFPQHVEIIPEWIGRAVFMANFLLFGTISYGIYTRKEIFWRITPILIVIPFLSDLIVSLWAPDQGLQYWLPIGLMIGFIIIGELFFVAWWRKQKIYFSEC